MNKNKSIKKCIAMEKNEKMSRPVELAAKASAEIRALRAEANKNELMYIIEKNPGLTSYELAKKIGWSGGKVRYYLRQLLEDNEVTVKISYNSSRLRKEIYAIDWKDMIDWSNVKEEKKE